MYIGIDLGTSNSVIAGLVKSEARVFHPADGGDVLPSVIYIDKRGHRLYGRRAYDQAFVAPENVASGFKRLMGTATKLSVGDEQLTAEECSAEIIRQLLGQASTEVGSDVFEGAIIAVPAAFNQMQSEATLRAARAAGLEKVDLLQEPVAAALASMVGAKRSGRFLIYDLGGGTFDLALVEAVEGRVRVLAQQGVNMLGGRDFDRMIVSEIVRPWLAANFDLPENFPRDPQYKRLMRVAQMAAEKAKIDLSSIEEAAIFASDDEIRLMDQSETEIFLDAPITRGAFEELIREPIGQTIDLIRNVLEESNVALGEIDRVVFVGGPSRIPLVRRMVTEELGLTADMNVDPMTAVAIGAAHYCESRDWMVEGLPGSGTAPASYTPTVKKTEETKAQPTEVQGLSFDYAPRTADEKTVVTLKLDSADAPETRQMKLVSQSGWDSGLLPLVDGLTIMVPLAQAGFNSFDVHLFDADGKQLPKQDSTLTITRVVASPASIPASQTIAVKTRPSIESEENVFLNLVTKGTSLPMMGQARFQSALTLKAGTAGSIGFEVYQVEYPERIDLNLCVGLFRIDGNDLPAGHVIRVGDPITFDWRMSEGGILQATVRLPANDIELKTPRFYAPQAAEMAFDAEKGVPFAKAVLAQGEESWGDLAAAAGPEGGPEVDLLKVRLVEQSEILDESEGDPEAIRRVVEETRFIRQDIARIGRKHIRALLQRQLGKLTAVYNRVARGRAQPDENKAFDTIADKLQGQIESSDPRSLDFASFYLGEMRHMFFAVAWRDAGYVGAWFARLKAEPFLFPDQESYQAMLEEGDQAAAKADKEALSNLVRRLLDARVALGATDAANEPAAIVRA